MYRRGTSSIELHRHTTGFIFVQFVRGFFEGLLRSFKVYDNKNTASHMDMAKLQEEGYVCTVCSLDRNSCVRAMQQRLLAVIHKLFFEDMFYQGDREKGGGCSTIYYLGRYA